MVSQNFVLKRYSFLFRSQGGVYAYTNTESLATCIQIFSVYLTQRYLINMQDDTRLQKNSFFLLERVCIPNTVIGSCQKHYISTLFDYKLLDTCMSKRST